MTIGLAFDPRALAADIDVGPAGVVEDATLATAILVSLLTDRRARGEDPLPAGAEGDRRGWVGDALADVPGDRIGSRLWLLSREKELPETLRRAEDYAAEALAWLVDDGHALGVEVRGEWIARGTLGLDIVVRLPDGGSVRRRLPFETGV